MVVPKFYAFLLPLSIPSLNQSITRYPACYPFPNACLHLHHPECWFHLLIKNFSVYYGFGFISCFFYFHRDMFKYCYYFTFIKVLNTLVRMHWYQSNPIHCINWKQGATCYTTQVTAHPPGLRADLFSESGCYVSINQAQQCYWPAFIFTIYIPQYASAKTKT